MTSIQSLDQLQQHIESLLTQQAEGKQLLVAIAGAPGSGKSTLAQALATRLNAPVESAIVVPMDGFHLDNALLDARGHQAVKGAPHTFDVDGLYNLIKRLGSPVDHSSKIYIPLFDRLADLSRNAAGMVGPEHRIILVEGNYLLLQRSGWDALNGLFDLRIMLDVPLETLESRLIQRWLDHGHDEKTARQRALSNDLPNAHVVLQESAVPDVQFVAVRQ